MVGGANDLGDSYLAASANAYGQGLDGRPDPEGFSHRVQSADALVHAQDHREVDLLDSTDFAAHEGGFARRGGTPGQRRPGSITSIPPTRRNRAPALLTEEIARIVRGRASNPAWIAGMMRHGYRGGAEIARSLEGVFAFAATLPDRLDRQFDGDLRCDAGRRRGRQRSSSETIRRRAAP